MNIYLVVAWLMGALIMNTHVQVPKHQPGTRLVVLGCCAVTSALVVGVFLCVLHVLDWIVQGGVW